MVEVRSRPVPVVRFRAYPSDDRVPRRRGRWSWPVVTAADTAYPVLRAAAHADLPNYLWNPREPILVTGDGRHMAGGGVNWYQAGAVAGRPVLLCAISSGGVWYLALSSAGVPLAAAIPGVPGWGGWGP